MLETNLDDVPGEVIGYTHDLLFAAGALDVFTTPISMKKNRPGVLLTVLAAAANVPALEEILFRELLTFGIRRYPVQRDKLHRRAHTVETPWGPVRGKLGWLEGGPGDFHAGIRRLRPPGQAAWAVAPGGGRGGGRRSTYWWSGGLIVQSAAMLVLKRAFDYLAPITDNQLAANLVIDVFSQIGATQMPFGSFQDLADVLVTYQVTLRHSRFLSPYLWQSSLRFVKDWSSIDSTLP